MKNIVYLGDHASVFVPISATKTIDAEWGIPVSVEDEVAEALVESGVWILADDQPKNKKKNASEKESEAIPAGDIEKGAN